MWHVISHWRKSRKKYNQQERKRVQCLFGKNSKRAKRRREQEEKLRRFKEEIQEVPLERNDYLAMVLGAFWALWPVLAIVAGVVLCVVLFFFR